MRGNRANSCDAGGTDGRVGVAEAADDGGDEFGKVRREKVSVRFG